MDEILSKLDNKDVIKLNQVTNLKNHATLRYCIKEYIIIFKLVSLQHCITQLTFNNVGI